MPGTQLSRPVVVGCGGLGIAVARALRGLGLEPALVARSRSRAVPADLSVTVCDVADKVSSRSVFADADVIFNCAAPPYGRWAEEFPPLQAGLMHAARRSGAVLVDTQNTYMYGHTPAPFDEDQPIRPVSRKGDLRGRLSRQLLAAHVRGDLRVAIGRIVSFYGPYQTEGRLGDRIFGAAVAGGRARVLGNLDLPHSASFVDDVAAGLVTLGLNERAWGQVWHLPAPVAITTRQFLDLVYTTAGHPARVLNPPAVAVRAVGKFNSSARELAEMLYMVREPAVADDRRFRDAFAPRITEHADGIARTVEWFRAAAPAAA
jgi:nucleoside-diphosphate-sugar epimerase